MLRAQVDLLAQKLKELEQKGSMLGAPQVTPRRSNTGIKVTTDLTFPVWDPKKTKTRPKLWIEKFKRFVRFQNNGAEPEPYAEVQLLVHAVPETSLPGRKIHTRLRDSDMRSFERTGDWVQYVQVIYEILMDEKDDPMIQRRRIMTEWDTSRRRTRSGGSPSGTAGRSSCLICRRRTW